MQGRAAALGAVIVWGFQFSIFADALRYVDAYSFSTIRFTLAAAVPAALLWVREERGALRFDGRLPAAVGYGRPPPRSSPNCCAPGPAAPHRPDGPDPGRAPTINAPRELESAFICSRLAVVPFVVPGDAGAVAAGG